MIKIKYKYREFYVDIIFKVETYTFLKLNS